MAYRNFGIETEKFHKDLHINVASATSITKIAILQIFEYNIEVIIYNISTIFNFNKSYKF